MRFALLLILWVIVIWQVIQAVKDTKRVYEYPFLITFGISVFILPTATTIVDRTGLVSDLAYTLMMGNILICYVTSLIAYHFYQPKINMAKKRFDLDSNKLFMFSLPYVIIGILSAIYLFNIDLEGGWYGLPVYVLFFARFLRPALVLVLASWLVKQTPQRLLVFLAGIFFPLYAVLIGRRFELAILVILISCTYHLIKKWNPPKFAVPVIISVSFIFVIMIPILRSNTLKANSDILHYDNISYNINKHLSGGSVNEFIESCYDIEAFYKSGEAGLGVNFWNSLVKQYVPRGIFGQETKDQFFLESPDPSVLRAKFSQERDRKDYLSPIGFTSAFFEFRYFAFVFFVFFAMLAKNLYTRATKIRTLPYITLYSMFSILCLMASYDVITTLHSFFLPYLLVWFSVYLMARVRAKAKRRYLIFWHPQEEQSSPPQLQESQSST